MTLFLLRVKNSAKIPCFARYLAGLIIQRGSRRGRRRMAQRGRRGNDKLLYLRTQPRDTGGTPRYRYPKFTSSTRKIFRENFIARIARERVEPVGNSLRKHESREGYLIRFSSSRLLPNTFCKRSGYIDLQFSTEARQANVV